MCPPPRTPILFTCRPTPPRSDRVILVALSTHWETWTVEQWVTPIVAAMKNFNAKYSNLKNLELSTFVRSPGDKPCPLGDTFRGYDLAPADQAFAKVAAMFPDLVTVAPIVHVDSCDDYAGHPPHLPSGPARARRHEDGRDLQGISRPVAGVVSSQTVPKRK
jgi:hypothetical protein